MGPYGYDFFCNYFVNTDAGVVNFGPGLTAVGLYDFET